jgi:arginase family enzyme
MMAPGTYLVFPGLLRREREDGVYTLHNPDHGTSLDIEPESRELVDELLLAFEHARRVEDFRAAQEDFPEELLELMVRSGFLVCEAELPFLRDGFMRPAGGALGQALSYADLPHVAQTGSWALLGVPVDAHALAMAGARHGPSEIRKAAQGALFSGEGDVLDHDFARLYPDLQLELYDLGDVDPEGGRMDHVGERIAKVVRDLFDHGVRPLLLGGDHSITFYALREASARHGRFGVIHFDAHADLLPARTLSHANPFHAQLEQSQLASFVQIGLRGLERMTPFARRVPCNKRQVVRAREVAAGRAHALIESLPTDLPYYLSFDIDCIDAGELSETGTPSHGGVRFADALELVDLAARRLDLLGADIVEVSGGAHPNRAATMAASLLTRIVLAGHPYEPLTNDVYVLPT